MLIFFSRSGSSVPSGLGTLPKLKSLALEGNPLRTIRRDILTVSPQCISAQASKVFSWSLKRSSCSIPAFSLRDILYFHTKFHCFPERNQWTPEISTKSNTRYKIQSCEYDTNKENYTIFFLERFAMLCYIMYRAAWWKSQRGAEHSDDSPQPGQD